MLRMYRTINLSDPQRQLNLKSITVGSIYKLHSNPNVTDQLAGATDDSKNSLDSSSSSKRKDYEACKVNKNCKENCDNKHCKANEDVNDYDIYKEYLNLYADLGPWVTARPAGTHRQHVSRKQNALRPATSNRTSLPCLLPALKF